MNVCVCVCFVVRCSVLVLLSSIHVASKIGMPPSQNPLPTEAHVCQKAANGGCIRGRHGPMLKDRRQLQKILALQCSNFITWLFGALNTQGCSIYVLVILVWILAARTDVSIRGPADDVFSWLGALPGSNYHPCRALRQKKNDA